MTINLDDSANQKTISDVMNLKNTVLPDAVLKVENKKISITDSKTESFADFVPLCEAIRGVEGVLMSIQEECPLVCAAKKQFKTFNLSGRIIFIAGPCSVENEKKYLETAVILKKLGVHALRAALFKPRSSPYAFQGLGFDGANILKKAKQETGLLLVTEVTDTRQINELKHITDILQIGARNMRNYDLLKEVGRSKMPVLLKRCAKSDVREFLLSAEYLLKYGTTDLILCERGDNLDSECSINQDIIIAIKRITNLPIFVDPSHSSKNTNKVITAINTAIVLGVNGFLIEADINPTESITDGRHTLNLNDLNKIISSVKINRKI